ncbi:MAG: outer membrane lipoprotein-sorting protein [Bacteroidales bacterium]
MKKLFTVLLFSMMMTFAWSQTVDEIIGKYFENAGGMQKMKDMKTLKMKGTFPTPQGDFDFEMCQKAPDKMIMTLDIMGQKMIPQAYDGQTAWMLNPFTGDSKPQKMPAEQAGSIVEEAEFEDPFIDYAKKGYEVTYEGTGDVDGVKCYILKLTKNKGQSDAESVSSYYLDSDTYLPLLIKQKANAGAMGMVDVDAILSDYRDAGDGIMMPFSIEQKMGGQTGMTIKFNTIEINQEIADDIFTYKGE